MDEMDDFAGRRANARRMEDAAWELIAEKLEKDARPARSNRPGAELRPQLEEASEQQSPDSDCLVGVPGEAGAIAGMEESAARADSRAPSDRTALRSPQVRDKCDDRTEQQPSPAGKEPLPGVV